MTVTNRGASSDVPPLPLAYSLVNPPAGAAINTNGVITWTPSEAQGPGTNVITTIVTDSGVPALRATNSFTIVVNEINTAPVLPVQTDQDLKGLQTLILTNTATDSDIPVNTLSYAFLTAPAGSAIDTNGVITWTPSVAQVPGAYLFKTVVTDYNPWAVNNQHLSATNTFAVVVEAIHNGPALVAQANVTIAELTTLTVTNTASDGDVPFLGLNYGLLTAPAGASIDTNGIITWTPSEAQGPSTNTFVTLAYDNGSPALSSVNTFTVVVNEINVAPVLPGQSNRIA